MLLRTHFALAVFSFLLFLNVVNDKILFGFVLFIATILPDIDSRFSFVGRRKIARVLQFFTKHRGVIHSFSFLILITLILLLIFPKISFAFFLGYSLHLLLDSFTKDGITPFYPLKMKVSGGVSTGGRVEVLVLSFLVFCSILLIFWDLSRIF